MKLYVKTIKVKNEHIVTFLKRCYGDAYSGWEHKFTETFYDEDCTKLQASKSRRSFDDLFDLVKTYYPKASDVHIAKQIKKLTTYKSINNKARLNFLYCPHADRWIMYENNNDEPDWKGVNYLYMSSYGSSYTKRHDRGCGKRSYIEILNLMGYTEVECFLS